MPSAKKNNVTSETPSTELSTSIQGESKMEDIKVPAGDTANVGNVNWGALLDKFTSEQSPVLFLKGKVKVRLLPFTDANAIFIPVTTYFRGKSRTKYLVKVWNLDDAENPVRALLITRSTVKDIINNSINEWDLFHPVTGHGVIFSK